MSDLISRQAAIDALYHVDEYNGRSVEAIRDLPSAQPDIIRCKECKHCCKVDESEYWCYCFCSLARLVRKDDFCSYGERREYENT